MGAFVMMKPAFPPAQKDPDEDFAHLVNNVSSTLGAARVEDDHPTRGYYCATLLLRATLPG